MFPRFLRLFPLLFDYPLIVSLRPLYNPLDNLVALPFLTVDLSVVDHVIELEVVFADDLQLRVHGVRLHITRSVRLGQSQGRVVKRVQCESKRQVGAR